ncbi:MAG: GNAT family N-acetyltransferase [Caldilineales bacterium]
MAFTPRPIKAKNGKKVAVRFLTPADGDLLVDFVKRLSPESRYQRFHVSTDDMPDAEIQRRLPPYLELDGENSVALVAVVKEAKVERAISIARFRRRPGDTQAEAAVVVRDDWHRQGLGSALIRQLGEMALSVGITSFLAIAQADNHAVHATIRASGFDYDSHYDSGEDYIVINLQDKSL